MLSPLQKRTWWSSIIEVAAPSSVSSCSPTPLLWDRLTGSGWKNTTRRVVRFYLLIACNLQ